MGSGSGEGVPLDFLPALYLSVDAPLLVQSSSATLPNLSRPQSWSSHLAGAHERQAFDHRCGRVAKLALERRRVQQRCPRAPTPEPGKGRRPKNRQSQRRKVFLPGCSVFSLSWPACAWSLLIPVRGFPGPAPSGSSLFWFRHMFLFIGRGRRVPAPSGRDVGSSAWAPTQEPAQGADPRTGFYRYPSAYGFVVYLVAPDLFFPLHFAVYLGGPGIVFLVCFRMRILTLPVLSCRDQSCWFWSSCVHCRLSHLLRPMRLLETTDSLTTRSTRLAQSAQKTRKNVVYPLPKEFVEILAEWYGAPLAVSAQIK